MFMRFTREFVQEVTEADSKNGVAFYRRLARMHGNRVILSYHPDTEIVPGELNFTFDTGQNIESHTVVLVQHCAMSGRVCVSRTSIVGQPRGPFPVR